MPRQNEDKFIIRLPNGWREAIKEKAVRNRRSMNSEILAALESVAGKAAGGEFGDQAPAAETNPAVSAAEMTSTGR